MSWPDVKLIPQTNNPRNMVFGTRSNTFRNVVNKDIMNECSLMMLVLLFGDCIAINIE